MQFPKSRQTPRGDQRTPQGGYIVGALSTGPLPVPHCSVGYRWLNTGSSQNTVVLLDNCLHSIRRAVTTSSPFGPVIDGVCTAPLFWFGAFSPIRMREMLDIKAVGGHYTVRHNTRLVSHAWEAQVLPLNDTRVATA